MTAPVEAEVDVVIVGAGFAGLYQLHRLRQLGLATRVFEAGDGVGGTWYWNRYPGARCDVESMSYSFSFDAELEQEWTWTEKYPAQPEILDYANHVTDRFGLRDGITFGARVTSATWEDPRWTVTTDTGETVSAQFVVMATGCLSASKLPEIPGLDRFAGDTFHTGHWPHEEVDFTGKRLGVIGTGSSGIQSIPVMAAQAADTTVFQRTANFSMPARNRPLTADEITTTKENYPLLREAQRNSMSGIPREPATLSALEVSPAERAATYEQGWERGMLVAISGSYTDILTDRDANETAAEFVRGKIRETVTDPGVAEMLSPRTFPYGTKRPCLDTGYYETFNNANVHLVDLRRTPLVEITERGVRTSEREYAFDAIVFATGFDAMTGALLAMDIRGRDGEELAKHWRDGPRTYLGLGIAGFPNLFTITGPSSPSVLSNMMVSIEQHVDWISRCIAHLREHDVAAIEPAVEAEDAWVAHVEEVGNTTLFPVADSWYMGANVPGKPRVFMAYIGGVQAYREHCDRIAADGYEGFLLTP
ncbi:flavin-containing monooxygenase [Pseudonocardia sp. GCM10023141]|uniref:flavin-containing monooxygenase n=1 Tax=Pseudonocardia sp. GCM10023141 TaxID=3252653 RepID=UPI003612D6CF